MGPCHFLFVEFANAHYFFGERFGDSLFDELFYHTDSYCFYGWSDILLNFAWQGYNRPTHYVAIKSSCLVDLQNMFRESFSRKWRKRRCPWKPMAYAVPLQRQGSLETIKVCCFLVESQHGLLFALGCLPDHSHSCRLHAVWARLCSTKADAIPRRKNNVELRKIRANIFYSRRMAVCRWKNLDILDQPPYPNSSWVKDGYSTGSRTRQGSWAELSPWPQVWPSQN